MPEQISNFEFLMKSNLPDFMDFTSVPIRAFPRIYFSDSMFNFFPYGEVYIVDPVGELSDKVYFIEGLEFNIKFGKIVPAEHLEHDYLWSEDSTNDIKIHNFISGTKIFILMSAQAQNDLPNSKAWDDIASNVVNDIIGNFKPPTTTNITTTSGQMKWYQFNKTNSEYLMDLSNVAFSSANAVKTPFYTFFNCAGDFYFMSLEDLFAQAPVAEYKFNIGEEMSIDAFTVKDAEIHNLGIPANKEGYNRKIFKLKDDGTTEEIQFLITDHFIKTDTETSLQQKLMIRKDTAQETDATEVLDLKVIESTESDFLQGRIINLYKDSALSYRFTIIINSNNLTVAGKTITLDIKSFDEKNKAGKATEYCGKWLILESEHYADEDGIPFTRLTLGKSGIPVDTSHPKKADFIG